MKGIILAGGAGTRLHPITLVVSKQLLPVYDKPMIYYPLSTLMLAGIREILIVTTPQDQPLFMRLLGDGSQFGLALSYAVQDRPRGIADAFRVGRTFIGSGGVTLILGDNIFFGHGLPELLRTAVERKSGATVFAYQARDAHLYGVVTFDADGRAVEIVEKPKAPKSKWAVTGLYCYDNEVVRHAAEIEPSARGELEITDINMRYLAASALQVESMGRGFAWLDTGTFSSLMEASMFIQAIEQRQAMKIACPEEIAFRMGYITAVQLRALARPLAQSAYGQYLERVLTEKVFT
jgi:glucose-1-phosphate thymidylyltransferase